ncbi:ferritin [Nocardia zapadnayensis]|uniref:Ferritin n=1 Tax=Brevibacterium pityocampae TaxID=506594 RepID=A0ABP8JD21_9MICO|nr:MULTISPECIES: ferritin [Actinomycetes]MCK1802395.1 ferritin [Brevibacterium sp. R8603A2]MCX0277520.1 ferritin [Nocardia zapadnayensis]
MRLSDTMARALSDQVTLELTASIVYLQLAIELDNQDLTGMSSWMRAQAEEEQVHAAKFISHSLDRGSAPQIGTIEAPSFSGRTPVQLFEAALAHEEKVSEAIRELYRTAQAEGDIDILPLLNWFVDEQLEEEASVGEIVGRLTIVGDDGSGLLRMDSQLGSRTPDIDSGE